MLAVPGEAMALAETAACNWVLETKVVDSALPLN